MTPVAVSCLMDSITIIPPTNQEVGHGYSQSVYPSAERSPSMACNVRGVHGEPKAYGLRRAKRGVYAESSGSVRTPEHPLLRVPCSVSLPEPLFPRLEGLALSQAIPTGERFAPALRRLRPPPNPSCGSPSRRRARRRSAGGAPRGRSSPPGCCPPRSTRRRRLSVRPAHRSAATCAAATGGHQLPGRIVDQSPPARPGPRDA